MAQYAVTIVIAIAIVGLVIYQQMRIRPVMSRQLVLVPIILCALGLYNIDKHPPASTAAAVALIASLVTALLFGVGRGFATHVWRTGTVLMRKGNTITLVLWLVGIGIRIVIGVVAQHKGVSSSVSTGELPLFLGLTLGVQNVLIWFRAQDSGALSPAS